MYNFVTFCKLMKKTGETIQKVCQKVDFWPNLMHDICGCMAEDTITRAKRKMLLFKFFGLFKVDQNKGSPFNFLAYGFEHV